MDHPVYIQDVGEKIKETLRNFISYVKTNENGTPNFTCIVICLQLVCHVTTLPINASMIIATATETSRTGRSGTYDVVVTGENERTIALFHGLSRTIKGQHFPEPANENGVA